jgi:protein SCO1/2
VRQVAAALVLVIISAAIPGDRALAYSQDNLAAFAFQPHPGALLPLSASLIDETGRSVALGYFFTGKPVIVVLDYLRCKSLCGVTLTGLFVALDALPLNAGRNFQMVVISIDPRDTPADNTQAKAKYLAGYRHRGAAEGVHFLTGAAASVRQIADAIGFPYRYEPDINQYIHPAGFILASPDGRISRYIFGVGANSVDLRVGLAGAAQGETLTAFERLVLLCHIEGAPLGRFTVPVMAALMAGNIAAGATAFFIVVGIIRRRGQG